MPEADKSRPRVGVPWRTAAEEAANRRTKIDKYLHAVERAGGEAVLLSLASSPADLRRQAEYLMRLFSPAALPIWTRRTTTRSAIPPPTMPMQRANVRISHCWNMDWPQANRYSRFAMGVNRSTYFSGAA